MAGEGNPRTECNPTSNSTDLEVRPSQRDTDNIESYYHKFVQRFYSEPDFEPISDSSRLDRSNLSRALGGLSNLGLGQKFYRRPRLVFDITNDLESKVAVIGLAIWNLGRSPILGTAGRITVDFPPTEIEGKRVTLIDNNRTTLDCPWVLPDESIVKEYNLYPRPDRILLEFVTVSSETAIIIAPFSKAWKKFHTIQSDALFSYSFGGETFKSRDFLATFTIWVRGATQSNSHVELKTTYMVLIPRLGKLGACDFTKSRVVDLGWKEDQSKLRELFQGLSRDTSPSPPSTPPSPSPYTMTQL